MYNVHHSLINSLAQSLTHSINQATNHQGPMEQSRAVWAGSRGLGFN